MADIMQSMMSGMGLYSIRVIVVAVLAIAALVEDLIMK